MNSPDLLVEAIALAFEQKSGVFSNLGDLLENQIPEETEVGSEEHARFYFFLIFNDHGTKSSSLYARFKTLFKDHPEIFNPSTFLSAEYRDCVIFQQNFLSGLGLRYPRQAALSWVQNAISLCGQYEGEPIKLFTHTEDAPSLFRAIRSFRGYGPKTAGLLLRVVRGVGFNRQLNNISEVPLPVDIHDSRIAFICHVYRPAGAQDVKDIYGNTRHIAGVESVWRTAAKNVGVEWETIDRALWILGSRGCTHRLCGDCPVQRYCDVGKQEALNATSLFDDTTLQYVR